MTGRLSSRRLRLLIWTVVVIGAACTGDPDDAVRGELRQPVSSRATVDPATLRDLLSHARGLYEHSDFDSARTILSAVARVARVASDSVAEAEALTGLGILAWEEADYAEAKRLGEEALAIKQRHGMRGLLPRSYRALGLVAWDEGRLVRAAELFRSALDIGRSESDSAEVAAAASNLGLIEFEFSNFDEAHAGFALLRDMGRELGIPRYEGNGLTNLGMLAIATGDPLAAIPNLLSALGVYRGAENYSGEQIALAQLANAYADLGEPRLAFAALDSARALSRALGQRDEEAINLTELASLHREAGNLKRALDLYHAARVIDEELGADMEVGTDLRNIAEIQVQLGNLDGAFEYAARALDLHRTAGGRFDEFDDLILLAEIAHLAGQQAEASGRLAEARAVASQLDARAIRLSLALTEARIADRDGNHAAVREILNAAEADLERAGPAPQFEAYSLLARAYAGANRFDQAASAGRRAVQAVERVRGRYGSSVLRASYLAERVSAYGDLVSALLRLGSPEEAFEFADRARGRALVERLGAARREVENATTAVQTLGEAERLLRRIDALVAGLGTLEMEEDGDFATASAMAGDLEQARSRYEALLVEAAERDVSTATFLGVRKVELGEVQAVLGPKEVLVEYLVADERVVLFVVRRDDVRAFTSEINEDELASRVRVARDLLADPETPSRLTEGSLEGLHSLLIGPAQRAGVLAGADRLIIIPHRVLNYLPFAALRDRETGRYLVEDYVLLHLPTAAVLPVLREREVGGVADARNLRISLFAPFSSSLRFTRAETRAIKNVAANATEHAGRRGTEARFRQALERGDVVHAATHGVLNPRNPMFSRIEFARGSADESRDDGRLEVHELLGVSIASPLVFLSGCETGVGAAWSTQFARGEDYATLAQAFLYAGASTVVATLWRIEDRGAAEFAELFYQSLGPNAPPDALAAAQRALMLHERYSAPYYWASYQVAGSGQLAQGPQNSNRPSVR